MKAEDLIELLEERPFIPLRLSLSDGRTHDVHHPEMAIVSEEIVTVGLPRGDSTVFVDRVTYCATAHIVEVEPVLNRS